MEETGVIRQLITKDGGFHWTFTPARDFGQRCRHVPAKLRRLMAFWNGTSNRACLAGSSRASRVVDVVGCGEFEGQCRKRDLTRVW